MKTQEPTPQYLYHYTNIDSLTLILKNKTIRFNSLDKMDDLQEQMSNDKQNFGKFVMVSSWTDDSTESIPMWRMYTPKQHGVRIKMRANPFVSYSLSLGELSKITNSVCNGDPNSTSPFKTILPAKDMFNRSYMLLNFRECDQLVKVIYTDDEALLKPTLLKLNNGDLSISVGEIGVHKNKYWDFQKEWRYKLMFMPVGTLNFLNDQTKGWEEELRKLQINTLTGQASLPFNYYDLSIRDDSFSDMRIMLAPDISESSKTLVELLVKEYNPNCKIETSSLTNLIK